MPCLIRNRKLSVYSSSVAECVMRNRTCPVGLHAKSSVAIRQGSPQAQVKPGLSPALTSSHFRSSIRVEIQGKDSPQDTPAMLPDEVEGKDADQCCTKVFHLQFSPLLPKADLSIRCKQVSLT